MFFFCNTGPVGGDQPVFLEPEPFIVEEEKLMDKEVLKVAQLDTLPQIMNTFCPYCGDTIVMTVLEFEIHPVKPMLRVCNKCRQEFYVDRRKTHE